MFAKLQSNSYDEGKVNPREIITYFKQFGFDKTKSSLYSMMNWITLANENSGTSSMTYEELMAYAQFFFSQRENNEGLAYIFQLIDTDRKGYIDKRQFVNVSSQLGLDFTREQIDEIYKKASSDGRILKFSEFSFFMRV